ncbi:MAG: T9SS type A sorting domain-containing protein [Bacteroidia bacterium]
MIKAQSLRILFTFIVSLLIPTLGFSQSQVWGWTETANTLDGYEQANGITTDPNGNVIITGFFQYDSITFGPVTLYNASVNAAVSDDIFLAKYDANGQIQWAQQIGSSASVEEGRAVATDPLGNILLAGEFSADSIVIAGNSLYNHPGYKSDIFLAKFSPSGSLLWATTIGHEENESVNNIHVDTAGNIFLAGWYASDSLVIGSTTLPPVNGRTALIVKLDPSGVPQLVKYAVCVGSSEFYDVTTDNSGNIIASGVFNSTSIQFDATVYQNPNLSNGQDLMIVKFDSTGTYQWIKSGGGTGFDYDFTLSADTAGNIYTSGTYFSPTFTLGGSSVTQLGQGDSWVAKLNSAGNLQWLRAIKGYLNDQVITGDLTPDGDYLVAGWFNSLSISAPPITITRNGNSTSADAILIRYNAAGNPVSYGQARGSKTSVMAGIASSANGRVYTCGYFNGDTLNFGTSLLYNYNSGGTNNLFVAELTSSFTSIEEIMSNGTGIVLFPNPANEQVHLQLQLPVQELRITDLSGRFIELQKTEPATFIQADIRHLMPGVYLIDGGINGCVKFIKTE